MADLTITVRTVDDAPIVDLVGEIDLYNAPKLRDFLTPMVSLEGVDIILNLADTDYIDSVGLGTLVQALKQAQSCNGIVRLVCPNETIFRMFTITGLVRVFTIHATEAQALSVGKSHTAAQ